MMRFPIGLTYSERNDKLCSENAYHVFATDQRIELGLKQAVVYPPRSILYHDSKQTVIQKFQDDSLPLRMWINSLLNNYWVARFQKILCLLFLQILNCFNYKNTICKIRLQVQKQALFPNIAEGVKKL
jgi:hypothetical protein